MVKPQHFDLIIRVDATKTMGIGHLMRCLAFAQICQLQGIQSLFICKTLFNNLEKKLKLEGFSCVFISESLSFYEEASQILLISKKINAKAILFDGYHFSFEYYEYFKDSLLKLFAIDDFGNVPFYFHLVLNFQAWATKESYSNNSKQFLGLEYFLLRRDFWPYFAKLEKRKQKNNVIVTMGGGDPFKLTHRLVEIIRRDHRLLSVKFSFIVNAKDITLEKLVANVENICIHYNPKNIPFLMSQADLAITAGGGTCWELAFMKVPALILIQAPNQEKVALYMEKFEVGVNLGFHEKIADNALNEVLFLYLNDEELRIKMHTSACKLNIGRKIADIGQYVKNQCCEITI